MLGAAMRFVFNLWRNQSILIPANRKAKARFLTKRFKNSRLATIETLEARFAFDVTLVTNDFRALPISVPDAQFSGQYLTSGILSATFDATLALTGNLDFVDFDSAPPSPIDFTGSGIINDLIFHDQYPITIDGTVNSQLDNGTLSVLSGSTFTVSVDFGGSTPLVRSGLLTPGTAGNFDPTSFSVNIPIDYQVNSSEQITGSVTGQLIDPNVGLTDLQVSGSRDPVVPGKFTFGVSVTGKFMQPSTASAPTTDARIYWSSSASLSGVLEEFPVNLPLYWNSEQLTVVVNNLGTPPQGATHLIFVADQDQSVSEANESNNVIAIALSDNLAPVLDASKSPALVTVDEDAPVPVGPVGTLVSTLVNFKEPAGQIDNVTDPNPGALLGIAITSVSATNGTWYYSINGGQAWFAMGNATEAQSRLLAANAQSRVYFRPNANFNGSLPAALTFRAWDRTTGANGRLASTVSNGESTAFSAASDSAAIVVRSVNDAPVLDASKSPVLTKILEDAGVPVGAVGTLVSALVDLATPTGQIDNVTDVDAVPLLGIAVTATTTTNGTWYYSTNNGQVWKSMGVVTDSSARLLAANADTRVYFRPKANYNGVQTTAFKFRSWDQTSGANGTLANTSTNGGTSAFSVASDFAMIRVRAVNDAPRLDATKNVVLQDIARNAGNPVGAVGTLVSQLINPGGTLQNVSDVDARALQGIAITAANTTSGSWFYSLNDGATWLALGAVNNTSSRLLAATSGVRVYFKPSTGFVGTIANALTIRAWDRTVGANGGLMSTAVNGGTSAFSTAADTASIRVV